MSAFFRVRRDPRTAVAVRLRSATARLRGKTVGYRGVVIPAKHLRPGGHYFQEDEAFVASGIAEAERLIEAYGLNSDSALLDIGCGVGRLAIGLQLRLGGVSRYHGLDVSRDAITWCERFIAQEHPGFMFTLIDVKNSRYNPRGRPLDGSFSLPVPTATIDVVYLYSVFSHMIAEDVLRYLQEIRRILKPSGKVFLTAFLEADVPEMTENPPAYRRDWIGSLHCVRFEREFFRTLVERGGLGIDRIDHSTETDGQSAVYLSPRQTLQD